MEFAYLIDGQGRRHRDLIKEIQVNEIAEENVYIDMGDSREELGNLLNNIAQDGILYLQTVVELGQNKSDILDTLILLKAKNILLVSCDEPILNGDDYVEIFKQSMDLMNRIQIQQKELAYKKAYLEGRVGRPPKGKVREKIWELQQKGLSVNQICKTLSISKTTYYRVKNEV